MFHVRDYVSLLYVQYDMYFFRIKKRKFESMFEFLP